jgi:hypothetical protein
MRYGIKQHRTKARWAIESILGVAGRNSVVQVVLQLSIAKARWAKENTSSPHRLRWGQAMHNTAKARWAYS